MDTLVNEARTVPDNKDEYVVDELSLVEAIKDLYDILLVSYVLTDDREVLYEIRENIWFLTNKWIEIIGTTRYIPGLIEKIGSIIKYRLWDVADKIDSSTIEDLLIGTYLLKKMVNRAPSHEFASLFNRVYSSVNNVLAILSDGLSLDNISLSDGISVEELVSIVVYVLVLSTTT